MPLDLSPFDALRAWLAPAVADEATDSILAPAVERCPKETETAANSGRIIVEGDVVYITFGKDDDRNPLTGQPSNEYIVPLHEDNERQHPKARRIS